MKERGFVIIETKLSEVWSLLTAHLTPRQELAEKALFDLYKHVVYAGGLHPQDEALWTPPLVALLHDCETRMKVEPEKIRAACHLVWGRPCYPGKGALTLCEPSGDAGALSLAHEGGELEVVNGA